MEEKVNVKMLIGQLFFYICLMVFIGYFADSPEFDYRPQTHGDLKLIVRHSGKLIGECVEPDPEEQKNLPLNMRVPMICALVAGRQAGAGQGGFACRCPQ